MSQAFWDDKRVLITGINGFAGSWLAEKLLERSSSVKIFGLKRTNSYLENIEHIKEKITLLNGDILDTASIEAVLRESEPYIVFHLAAQASARRAYEKPFETFSLNFTGTFNLMDMIRKFDGKISKIHFASSSNVYGYVKPEEIPIKETQEIRPIEMYGISKASAENLCKSYFNAYGLPVVITRAFHHEGPRCNADVIGMQIVQQGLNAKDGLTKNLAFGNVDAVRDFSDVRDIVNGYILAVQNGWNGEAYNLCSGKGYKIRELIAMMTVKLGLSGVKVEIDQTRVRKKDMPILIGDNSKAKNELGWKPEKDFKDTLVELINQHSKAI